MAHVAQIRVLSARCTLPRPSRTSEMAETMICNTGPTMRKGWFGAQSVTISRKAHDAARTVAIAYFRKPSESPPYNAGVAE